jgi:competence protein ComEC
VKEFDRERYLRQLDADFRAVPVGVVERRGHSRSFYSLCQEARVALGERLGRVLRDSSALALTRALCLGDRSGIAPGTRVLFSDSGTVHLLAVSGLHMGAIYLLLGFVLEAAGLPRRARLGCVLPLLWVFAGITGFSPSAVRAATILSFIVVARLVGRVHSPVSAVCASGFFTLLLSPGLLYSVSFQMSYAAYTGIVLALPVARAPWWWPPVARRVVGLLALSAAAQLGTLPLVAYYFHFVNLNSVLINVVVVPVASCLLYAGVVLMALPGVVAGVLAFVPVAIERVVMFLLELYRPVAFNLRGVYPTVGHVLLFYAAALWGLVYARGGGRMAFRWMVVSAGLFFVFHGAVGYADGKGREVVVFDRWGRSEVVLNFRGRYAFLARGDTTAAVPPYVVAKGLRGIGAPGGFVTRGLSFEGNRLVTPRLTLYVVDEGHVAPGGADVVVVTGDVYPDRLSGEAPRVARVIVDRSNSFACGRRWEAWGAGRGARVERCSEVGSVIVPLPE